MLDRFLLREQKKKASYNPALALMAVPTNTPLFNKRKIKCGTYKRAVCFNEKLESRIDQVSPRYQFSIFFLSVKIVNRYVRHRSLTRLTVAVREYQLRAINVLIFDKKKKKSDACVLLIIICCVNDLSVIHDWVSHVQWYTTYTPILSGNCVEFYWKNFFEWVFEIMYTNDYTCSS